MYANQARKKSVEHMISFFSFSLELTKSSSFFSSSNEMRSDEDESVFLSLIEYLED